MTRVCAIVINYFAADKTRACLESLRGESFDTLRIIDNSADPIETAKFEKTVADFGQRPPGWPVLTSVNECNLGFGRAINRAVQADQGGTDPHDYYLLLNNDAVGTPGFVGILVDKMNESPHNALVTPQILWGGKKVCLNWYQRLTGHLKDHPLPWAFAYATGCCLLVDSRLIDESGGLFDEDFFMYGEDVLLNWRAHQAGLAIACADEVQIVHEGSGSSSHGGLFFEYHVARGHVLLAYKTARNSMERIISRLGRLVYLAMRALVRSARYRSKYPLQAYFMAWSNHDAERMSGRTGNLDRP